ncbi:MAG: hypothetical protein ACHQQS_15330 [Thermoanaerobaculales bacterium]
MLNELFDLSESLAVAGVKRQSWHKDYGPCPNYKTFKVLLGPDGRVVDLEPVSDRAAIESLRKWEVANGVSFPAFNAPPLFHAASDTATEAAKALRKAAGDDKPNEAALSRAAASLEAACAGLWTQPSARIESCLHSHSAQLAAILGEPPPDFSSITELIKRASLLQLSELRQAVQAAVLRHAARSPSEANNWIDTLLVSSARNVRSVRKVSLVLEVADRSSFAYPANHDRVQAWINSRLMDDSAKTHKAPNSGQNDAFGQPLSKGADKEKYPDVSLLVLGKVALRAMNSESPCQRRYGRADAASFPAGQPIRQAMKDSLEWLTKRERKGKTWQDVSGTCGFTKRQAKRVPISAVLLAYPSALPEQAPELAGYFGGNDREGDGDGARFEACAERVTSALGLIISQHPETEIRILVLVKADKARTKLVVSKGYDARRLIAAGQMWYEACRRIPHIQLSVGTASTPQGITPLMPYPREVVECLSLAWLQGGGRANPVRGLSMGEGIELLAESGPAARALAERALHLAIVNTSPLLLALGHADHRRDGKAFSWTKSTEPYSNHAEFLPCVLGLLLSKLGNTKGEPMQTAPFLVGRLLALADTLHKEYCRHVRKNQVPPQLLGNAIMQVALDNPAAGLARLSARIGPYQAWANTTAGEGVGLAKWALGQLGRATNELGSIPLPSKCDDAARAQMLLGYLGRVEADSAEPGARAVPDDKEATNA